MKSKRLPGKRLVILLLVSAMLLPLTGRAIRISAADTASVQETGTESSAYASKSDGGSAAWLAPALTPAFPPKSSGLTGLEIMSSVSTLAGDDRLTETQRNTINMLNYMTALIQKVNQEKGSQVFLESAYNSFDNLYPNAVDAETQAQIANLMDTIQTYRMTSVKRDRLQFIYEKNRAQALRKALPGSSEVLSAMSSGSLLKAIASFARMTVDFIADYKAELAEADLEFIKDGWELDDSEAAALHSSTRSALTYLLNMVRNYDIPGDYALGREAVEDFVLWSEKPDDSRLIIKTAWFEAHQNVYSEFGPYWLELAKDYYYSGDFERCLAAVRRYETVATRIFRKDIDYAAALPMAVVSAKETLPVDEYVKTAGGYCSLILANTKDSDWLLRYFAAQVYLDLYSITQDVSNLENAYRIAFDNILVLVDEQKSLNETYLADVQTATAEKDATKREKEEIKQYNNAIREERKTALPPISEPLYLYCDLLFDLAERLKITPDEQNRIDAILHENGDRLFLTQALDRRFSFNGPQGPDADAIEAEFDSKTLKLPADCVTERSVVKAEITGGSGTVVLDDWITDSVERPQNADVSEFEVTYKSQTGKSYKYRAGDTVTVTVIPLEELPDEQLEFRFNAVSVRKFLFFKGVKFERA